MKRIYDAVLEAIIGSESEFKHRLELEFPAVPLVFLAVHGTPPSGLVCPSPRVQYLLAQRK